MAPSSLKNVQAQAEVENIAANSSAPKSAPNSASKSKSKARSADSASSIASDILVRFKNLYQSLNRDSLTKAKLADFYADDIEFCDSLHRIDGLDAMFTYFETMYENVPEITFEFHDEFVNGETSNKGPQAMITWTMSFRHKRLNKGNSISVSGSTLLKVRDEKVVFHRDYFDAGEMLYEHIPGLALVIRQLKKRLA